MKNISKLKASLGSIARLEHLEPIELNFKPSALFRMTLSTSLIPLKLLYKCGVVASVK